MLSKLSKLKNLSRFNKRDKKLIDLSSIQDNLSSGLFKVMEDTFNQKKPPIEKSNNITSDVDKIIKQYAKRNMMLAAASSIVPGPLGILSSIPELILNFGNQMNMIYDLGNAYGQKNLINKDILLDIPIAVFGGNTNLSLAQNNKINLTDSPEQILISKATQLAENVVQKTLKKSIVQFIPIAGSVIMTTWAKMNTLKTSKASVKFFDVNDNYEEHFKKEETEEIKKELQIEKIKGLANLIESNNEINDKQIEFINPIIQNSDLSESEKEYFLRESLKTGSNFQLNYQLLKDYEEDESLMMELIIMAKRSQNFDALEKEYIHKVGSELNLEASFIDELIL